MLNKDDLQQIRGVVQEVVKNELKDVVRNDELKNQLKPFITRDELKAAFEAQAVLIKLSFEEVQEQFDHTNGRINSLYNSVDGFVGKITRLEDEYHAIVSQMKRRDQFYPLPQG